MGYTGGKNAHPSYQSVCAGDGHSEAIQVEYDPAVISYEDLVEVFFTSHFPSPAPAQYKSAIWYHDEQQKQTAEKVAGAQKGEASAYTEIQPAVAFHAAEEYHQKYYSKMRSGGSSFWGDSL